MSQQAVQLVQLLVLRCLLLHMLLGVRTPQLLLVLLVLAGLKVPLMRGCLRSCLL
jgi:hypothetical protein